MATSARLDELKKKFDENPRRYFAPLANEYRKQGDLAQAIALCRTHLPNQPGHISGNIVLAQALYESRELAESRLAFEAALDLDPENLIALRYLGDIAREQGAPGVAQTWYQRVLEADPRNDEIAGLLREVDAEAAAARSELASSPTPPANAAAPLAAPPAHAATEDVQAPESPAFVVPAEEESVVVTESFEALASVSGPADESFREDVPFFGEAAALGDLEAVAEPSIEDWFTEPPAAPSESAPVAADELFPDLREASALPSAPHASAAADVIEEFTMDWASVEATAASDGEAEAAPSAADPGASAHVGAPGELAPDSTEGPWSAGDTPSTADTYAWTMPDEASPDASSGGASTSWNEPEPVQADEWSAESADDRSFVPPSDEVSTEAAQEIPVAGPDAFADAGEPAPDYLVGRTPPFTDRVEQEPPAPFVTETMAELYLQQGFNEEALAIYRQLLAQAPTDESLRRRVVALEQGSESTVVDMGSEGLAATSAVGSVRAFFARFATRTPRQAGGQGGLPNADAGSGPAGSPATMGGAARREEALTQPDERAVSLTEVFADRPVSAGDAEAATTLASAFGVAAPADRGGELSLEHLFRDVQGGSPGAVTSGEYASDAMSGPSEGQGTEVESHADIEQFTAWLEGLKKK